MSKARLIRQLAAKALRRIGLDVRRAVPPLRDALQAPVFDHVQVETIFDVGAHIGESTAELVARFPEAQVYCFEPFEASRLQIERRFSGNDHVHVVDQALAEEPGIRTLHVNEHRDMNSLLSPDDGARSYHLGGGTDEKPSVAVSTIDVFMRARSLSRIGFLKIDVEGAEGMCLRGARGALSSEAVDVIQLEMGFAPRFADEASVWDIGSYLAGFGYEIYDLYKPKRASNGQLRVADALFVTQKLAREIRNRPC